MRLFLALLCVCVCGGGVLRPCSFWCIHFMLIVAWDLMCRHSLLLFYLYYGGNSLSFAIKRNIGVTDRCWVNLGGYSFFFFWRVAWYDGPKDLHCSASQFLISCILTVQRHCFINRFYFSGQKAKTIEGLCIFLPFVYKK